MRPTTEPVKTMRPQRPRIVCLVAHFAQRRRQVRFTLMTASHSASPMRRMSVSLVITCVGHEDLDRAGWPPPPRRRPRPHTPRRRSRCTRSRVPPPGARLPCRGWQPCALGEEPLHDRPADPRLRHRSRSRCGRVHLLRFQSRRNASGKLPPSLRAPRLGAVSPACTQTNADHQRQEAPLARQRRTTHALSVDDGAASGVLPLRHHHPVALEPDPPRCRRRAADVAMMLANAIDLRREPEPGWTPRCRSTCPPQDSDIIGGSVVDDSR